MLVLTTKEVAQLLKVNIRTVQRKAENNTYPKSVCFKVGKQYRFIEERLLDFLTTDKLVLGE